MERGVASRGARLVTARPGRPWDPARRALGPGCEELAVTDPDASPVREARPRAQNRHGGAPRGGRPSPRDARRLTSAWRVRTRRTGASQAPDVLSALRPPLIQVREAKSKPRAQKTRRGNEKGCLQW